MRRLPNPLKVKTSIDNAIDQMGSTITLPADSKLPDGVMPKAVIITRQYELQKAFDIEGEGRFDKLWSGFQFKGEMADVITTGMELNCVNGRFKVDLIHREPLADVILYILVAAYQV